MKNDIGDIIKTSNVYGKQRIGIITRVMQRTNKRLSYYIIICGSPELNEVHIEDYEVEENITKKTVNKNTIINLLTDEITNTDQQRLYITSI